MGSAGHALSTTDTAIFCAGVLVTLLYRFAFGGGDPAKERRWAIMLYSICGLVLGAEVRGGWEGVLALFSAG